MTSILPKGTLGSGASLLAATPYQENRVIWEMYTHMQVLLECCYI
jgi:hypothetical protein